VPLLSLLLRGCPFYDHMDYGAHWGLRRVILGLRDEVLASNTNWRCVGCHTCSAIRPMAIDIAYVMDVLTSILALALGATDCRKGFYRDMQDPSEILKARGIHF
jgi:heterodisulfide reductase subunit C